MRKVAERDGWKCTPGCSNRTALTANHMMPRARGGSDETWNLHTVCAVCHAAITEGRLRVKGRAPNRLTWEGSLGVIEKPLPLPSVQRRSKRKASGVQPSQRSGGAMISRDSERLMACQPFPTLDHVIQRPASPAARRSTARFQQHSRPPA